MILHGWAENDEWRRVGISQCHTAISRSKAAGSFGCSGAYCCLCLMLRAKQSTTEWHERHSTETRRISHTAANSHHCTEEDAAQCFC